jgi:branched-subunit amino acid aminotransferase/4-amino-4-deoxychorismate lyase
MDRLERSAKAMGVPLPARESVESWLQEAASNDPHGEGCLRLVATIGGGGGVLPPAPPNVYILWSPLPKWPAKFSLLPFEAHWHAAGKSETIKFLSYAPNVLSSRRATAAGFTDALLLASTSPKDPTTVQTSLANMYVLDGPNMAIGWISQNSLYFPCWKQLGLLQSTTQVLAAQAGNEILNLPVHEGIYQLSNVLEADEVFVMSSTRGIIPVDRIGETSINVGPLAQRLKEGLDDIARG